jgi:integrase
MGRTASEPLTTKSILKAQKDAKTTGKEQWLAGGNGLVARAMASGKVKFYRRYMSPTASKRVTHYLADFDPTGKAGVTLSEAGVMNAAATKLINDQVDPVEHKADLQRQAEEARRQRDEAERLAHLVITVGGLFKQWFENRIQPEFKRPEWLRRDVMGSVLAYEFKPDGKTAIKFEDIPAKEVTRAHVVEIVEATQQRGANALANDQLRYLERMFEYGMTKDHLDVSPFAKIEKRAIRKREQARARALSRDELRIILRTLDGMRASWQVQCVIALAIHTAQRTGYVCNMEWTEIVGDEWRIPPEKQAKEERRKTAPQVHVVYLTPQAIELLDTIRHITGKGQHVFKSERVKADDKEFPIPQRSVEQSIGRHLLPMPGQGHRSDRKAVEDLKPYWDMPHFNAHDLRRSVATRMAEDVGIQPHIIEKILNHAPSNELAAIYNRATYEKERKEAAAKWGKYLAGLVADNVLTVNFGKKVA